MTTPQPQTREVTIVEQICKSVDAMKGALNEMLEGTGVPVDRFIMTSKTAIQSHNDLPGLEKANRKTLFLAIQKAASDGLLPDGREAALVIYNVKTSGKDVKPEVWEKQVQYQPMMHGLIKLARKSKEIMKISSFVVYEKDHFKFNPATMDIPDFSPEWFGDRGKAIGVWSMIKLTNGEHMNEIMTAEQIKRKAGASKVPNNYDPEKGRDYEEWWKKMGIRNILKTAPRSTALEQALEKDNQEFEFENNPVTAPVAPVNPISDNTKTPTRAAIAVKANSPVKAESVTTSENPPAPAPENGTIIEGEFKNNTEEEEIPV